MSVGRCDCIGGDPRQIVRMFLARFIGGRLDDGDDIFQSGHVDSLFAIQLVLLVERDFGIKVANRDLELANFRSVDAIVAFIESKRGSGH